MCVCIYAYIYICIHMYTHMCVSMCVLYIYIELICISILMK